MTQARCMLCGEVIKDFIQTGAGILPLHNCKKLKCDKCGRIFVLKRGLWANSNLPGLDFCSEKCAKRREVIAS